MAPWCLVKVGLSSALASIFDGSMVFAWPMKLTCFYDNMLLEKIQTQKGSNECLFILAWTHTMKALIQNCRCGYVCAFQRFCRTEQCPAAVCIPAGV